MHNAKNTRNMLLAFWAAALAWRVCDVHTEFGAAGDGVTADTESLRSALRVCDEVVLREGRNFLTGPLNLTSNQQLTVHGTLLASTHREDYPKVAPVLGYGWGNDENCFGPGAAPHKVVVGSLRYAPVLGAYHAKNVTIAGSGVVDGQGSVWWQNCTACHYPPHTDPSKCETASRPKLIETQFVDGLRVLGMASSGGEGTLTLANSPFWTCTPSYTQNIHIRNLRILAPMDRIGNTDGVNLDSCRNALVENLVINNSDDGVCIKSGLNGFGLNLAVPTENVLVRNITCPPGGRGGFAIGSEMSGGLRNVTFEDSGLFGQRGIDIKPSRSRGGYIMDLTFRRIAGNGVHFGVGHDGAPLMPGNDYVPLVANIHFDGVKSAVGNSFGACAQVNQSKCFNVTVDGRPTRWNESLPAQHFGCKRQAHSMGGVVDLPWPVCVPTDAPVNLDPSYPNWGPTTGNFLGLEACLAECK